LSGGTQTAGSPRVGVLEWARVAVGALLGLAVVGVLSHWIGAGNPWSHGAWLVAPIGASAVIVFALPSSPLGRPWSVIGGNTLGTLVGIACVHLVSTPWLAAGLAVGLAIALMLQARCLHPPGGAAALLAVLTQTTDWRFALIPVALNSALLVATAWAWHTLTRRPHPAEPAPAASELPTADALSSAIDAAVDRYGEVLDIDRDTLRTLLAQAQTEAYLQRLHSITCADIMHRDVLTLRPDDTVEYARRLLDERGVKALPVVDARQRVVGIVTGADLRHAPTRNALQPDADVVAARMTPRVQTVTAQRHLAELLPLFVDTGHHHIPVIDADRRLAGMLTQTDVMRALHRPRSAQTG
jgi:CBS domain-containing membrane protein